MDDNTKKIITILVVTLIIAISIILSSYIIGSSIKEGLLQLGVNINNGVRNITFQ